MPDDKDLKTATQTALSAFEKKPLAEASLELLKTLGYRSERGLSLKPNTADQFRAEFDTRGVLNPDAALVSDWKSVDLLIQITDNEIREAIKGAKDMFASKKVDDKDIRSYLFFAVELNGTQYTRTQLAGITREINKLFPMPVMVIFQYNKVVSLAIIARRINKKDGSKDVLEKVMLIKDIRFTGNRAQIEILHDLAITQLMQGHVISNFVDLQKAWEKTLDLNELNKKFYKEIANWYFWAVKTVKFPKDAEKDEATRNATGVIRLITRLIFVWFIKEKGLVPEDLFDARWLKDNLDFGDTKKSTYYKAILQNLFFATLNTEMGAERVFRRENAKGQDPDYLMSNFYRYKRYFKQPDAALELFAGIPFLNGGLFECLDKEEEKDGKRIVIRVDGFSDRDDNPLTVPDKLFLQEKEEEFDLNEIYDTKNKKYKVRGLIHIFNSYKFTIEENTPIEEEIALDPELLGKVFENLLAAYNPETGTTARKQTGSFYTPREIVNYMVDEALVAYLETALKGDGGQKTEDGERLRQLLAYTLDLPAFSDAEKTQLIAAIDNVKVLDPAAGSGAFPMGMLHKLVFLLAKLDPKNEGWQRKQISKANEIQDSVAREAAVKSIEQVFAENHDNYGRKLYLIENCIYGVDIQPIAVQIAKLRFFISLVVDQKMNAKKPNLGILQLPNLETKFVAANTLIGINHPETKPAEEKPISISPEIETLCSQLLDSLRQYLKVKKPEVKAQWLAQAKKQGDQINDALKHDDSFQPLAIDWIFNTAKDTAALKALLPVKREAKASPMVLRNQQIEEKEKELERVRREHFSARTPATKRKYRDLDKKLRLEIADLLSKNHALADEAAQQLAGWDPYNQNAHADFFDPEWMFGIEGGFDVVIANPPYGVDYSDDEKKTLKNIFRYKSGKSESYIFFIEKSLTILKPGAILSFIIPNAWVTNYYGQQLRKYLLEQSRITQIVNLEPMKVFSDAIVDTVILVTQNVRSATTNSVLVLEATSDGKIVEKHSVLQTNWESDKEMVFNIMTSHTEATVIEKVSSISVPLSEICEYSQGIIPYKTKEDSAKSLYISSKAKNSEWKPLLESGNCIGKYTLSWHNQYICYGSWLWCQRDAKYFEEPKLLFHRIRKKLPIQLVATYDEQSYYNRHSLSNLIKIPDSRYQLKYILGLFNSKLLNFWFIKKFGLLMEVGGFKVGQLPIRSINFSLSQYKQLHNEMISFVDKILTAKRADPQADTSALEGEIDQLVYQLYGLTEDEVKIVEGK